MAATKSRDLIEGLLEPPTRDLGADMPSGRGRARWSLRRLVYTSWPRGDNRTPDHLCQAPLARWLRSALAAAELGHDPVPVAPVDRLDELDGAVREVAARALEEEGRRMQRHAERRRLLLVRHRRLDR